MSIHRCPIGGHSHTLIGIRTYTQDGTGKKADLWECPNGTYRWLIIRGNQLTAQSDRSTRQTRPRFGWAHSLRGEPFQVDPRPDLREVGSTELLVKFAESVEHGDVETRYAVAAEIQSRLQRLAEYETH